MWKIRNILSNWYYEIRAIFFPWNVLKVHNCPRTWHDRDYHMFHAVFQILVDFIELEQPYIHWDNQKPGRITDIQVHAHGMNLKYNPILQDANEFPGPDYYQEAYKDHSRIMALYAWYKNREWDRTFIDYDKEREFNKLCDDKLCEVIRLRRYYWT